MKKAAGRLLGIKTVLLVLPFICAFLLRGFEWETASDVPNSNIYQELGAHAVSRLLGGFLWLYQRYAVPQSGNLRIQGLLDRIVIKRDKYGVPHVFGTNDEDITFAHGFLHAIDRTNQMEYSRYLAKGRLSELVGASALVVDLPARALDFCRLNDESVGRLSDAEMQWLRAYAAGVTAGFKSLRALPLEFVLLGHRMELEWTVEDTICVARFVMYSMARGWTLEAGALAGQSYLEPDVMQDLFDLKAPEVAFVNPYFSVGTALPSRDGARKESHALAQIFNHTRPTTSEDWSHLRAEKQLHSWRAPSASVQDKESAADSTAESIAEAGKVASAGSNAWVVRGSATKSGKPILAGDPHLPLRFPSVWYPAMLNAVDTPATTNRSLPDEETSEAQRRRSIKIIGAGIPGLPGNFIGHNKDMAWSITLNYYDMQDLVQFKTNKEGTSYFVDGLEYPFMLKKVSFKVKGQLHPHTTIIRESHVGPVISDYVKSLRDFIKEDEVIALHSLPLTAKLPFHWGLRLQTVANAKELIDLANDMPSTGLTMVFASKTGDIGSAFTGAVPARGIRPRIPLPLDGSRRESLWKGVEPCLVHPHLLNPPRGFVFSSNQCPCKDPDEFYGRSYNYGERSSRISNLLEHFLRVGERYGDRIDVDNMVAMQRDVYDAAGCEFHRLVLDYIERLLESRNAAEDARIGGGSSDFIDVCKGDLEVEEGRKGALKLCIKDTWAAFKHWDCYSSENSVGAAVSQIWRQMFFQELFKANGTEQMEALELLLGFPVHTVIGDDNEMRIRWTYFVTQVIKAGAAGDDQKYRVLERAGGLQSALCNSYHSTLKWLTKRLGFRPKAWRLGRLNTHFLGSPLNGHALLRRVGAVKPIKTGGSSHSIFLVANFPSVLQTEGKDRVSFGNTGGFVSASARLAVDMGNFTTAQWSVPPGVTSWLGSPYYASELDNYAKGTTHRMYWDKAEIDAATQSTQILLPIP